MRMYDVIDKKKKGEELTREEICYAINGYVAEEIPDYQMAAFLMAVYYQGMTDRELYDMTDTMTSSGEIVDLSNISGIKVDKHSTGGVGDKTTLVVGPIVAACGGKVAKMSGRGLGFTGGTIDKLESIPGLETSISKERFYEIVNRLGVCIIGQSPQIAPADKKLYALRDVTATVDSIPLIAASIMSKKLAAGSDKIVLDVTVGSGAFMKEEKDARTLAERMVEIGENAGKETVAILTNMDVPLGNAVGNNIEVIEAIHTLQGKGPADFETICIEFAAYMLQMSQQVSTEKNAALQECRVLAKEALTSGRAYEKFIEMVKAQGGDEEYIRHIEEKVKKPLEKSFVSPCSGYITHMNTELCGKMASLLGAGRETKESVIDPDAGIMFTHKTGDYVREGEVLAILYSSREEKLQDAWKKFPEIYEYGTERVEPKKEILGYVMKK